MQMHLKICKGTKKSVDTCRLEICQYMEGIMLISHNFGCKFVCLFDFKIFESLGKTKNKVAEMNNSNNEP